MMSHKCCKVFFRSVELGLQCALLLAILYIDLSDSSESRVLSSNSYCSTSTLLEGGTWVVSNEFENTGWDICPSAKLWVAHNYLLKYQIDHYACSTGYTYHKATYKYADSGCKFWNYIESVSYISSIFMGKFGSPLLNVFVIGDSIGGQYAVAARCNAELHSLNETVRVDFWHDHTLRNDVPCFANCTSSSFRRAFHWMCSRCGVNGTAVPFEREAGSHFANIVPAMTNILIITSGIWYNNFKFSTARPEQLYNVTLQLTAPVLRNMVKRGIIVVWVALPYNQDGSSDDKRLYGWEQFAAKDNSVKHFFRDTGVIFVDANAAIEKRLRQDPQIFMNRTIHYCNPGPSSIPMFVNNIIMQQIASALYGGKLLYYVT